MNESGTKSIWDENDRSAHKRGKATNRKTLHNTSLRSFEMVERVESAKMSLTYLIHFLFSGLNSSALSARSMPIMQFLPHSTFMTATFHYDYTRKHKPEEEILCPGERIVSHPLSIHKSFKDVRQKSRKINKQKEVKEELGSCWKKFSPLSLSLFVSLCVAYFDTEIKSN